MHRATCFAFYFAVAVLVVASASTLADQWSFPEQREFTSENGKFVFRVTPHTGKLFVITNGFCKGELFKIEDDQRKLVWSRYLINNASPHRVLVTNSGGYVVTMDEWGHLGKLPVVIYGSHGELIQVHNQESLKLRGDVLHIKRSVSSFWWAENSIAFFSEDSERLFIRLHWGKTMLFDLWDGSLMDEDWYRIARGWHMKEAEWRQLHDYGVKRSGELALRLLESADAGDRLTGAMAAGQLKLRLAEKRLRELLADGHSWHTSQGGSPYYKYYDVRDAAMKALREMGLDPGPVTTTQAE